MWCVCGENPAMSKVKPKWGWACVLASAMAMATAMHVSGESQTCQADDVLTFVAQVEKYSPEAKVIAGRYGAMGMENMGTMLSLCFIFIVGVSTGFLWKASFHKHARASSEPQVELHATPASPPPTLSPSTTRKVTRVSSVGSLKQYRLKEILDMTDRFKLQLGRGGQGVVYFASLPEGGKVAVKRLQKKAAGLVVAPDNHSQEMIERAFWAELKTISRLHHRNLVALLGYCVEDDDLFLVYEFMGKGSLSQRLHPKELEDAEGMVLDWKARLRCAVEVAQGLEYLHSHANPSLVHRDIKSGNILFDDDMNAKIADFGLSKAVALDHEATVTTRVRGTHGYVDPVYLQEGIPCDKNDVYSYGVVLLELITGRKAIQQRVNLVQWCKDILGPDEHVTRHLLPRLVDNRISLDISYDQLYEVLKVARSCVKEKQEDRPTMQDVVAWLHGANSKLDLSTSAEFPTLEPAVLQVALNRFGSNIGSTIGSTFEASMLNNPPTHTTFVDCSPFYEIKENSVIVKCTIAGSKIVLRCKIWPTPRNFGLNKVEASLNGAFLWKKGLWWYNARSSREFIVGDDIKLIAEWHVTLRTNWDALPPNDPRRNQGPFCIEYLAIKDEHKSPLIEYLGDRSPLVSPYLERKPRRESSGSGSGSGGSGSGSAERRKSNHPRREYPELAVTSRVCPWCCTCVHKLHQRFRPPNFCQVRMCTEDGGKVLHPHKEKKTQMLSWSVGWAVEVCAFDFVNVSAAELLPRLTPAYFQF